MNILGAFILAAAAAAGPVNSPVPWGDPGKTVQGGQAVPVRARVSFKAAPGNPLPVAALGKPIEILYEVKNEGASGINLWHSGFWPNHTIEVQFAVNGEVPLTQWGKQVRSAFSPGGPRNKNVEWKIGPGQFDNTEGAYDLATLFDLSAPGYYRVQVKYQEDFEVDSNVLLFYVLPEPIPDLLDRLNGWDKGEIDRVERPEQSPGWVAAGESRGFVDTYKAELRKAGAVVVWHPEWQLFIVTDSAVTPDRTLLLAEWQHCAKNQECALAQAGCCGCDSGGQNAAVRKDSLPAFRQRIQEHCRAAGCSRQKSGHPSCRAKAAACVNGWCLPVQE